MSWSVGVVYYTTRRKPVAQSLRTWIESEVSQSVWVGGGYRVWVRGGCRFSSHTAVMYDILCTIVVLAVFLVTIY